MLKSIPSLFGILLAAAAPLCADLSADFKALAGDDYSAREAARIEIAEAVNRASAPDAPSADRERMIDVLVAECGVDQPFPTRDWAIRQLGLLGDDGAVEVLAELLNDQNAMIRDLARKSLGQIGGESALRAIAIYLDQAQSVEEKIGGLQGLSSFGSEAEPAVPMIAPYLLVENTDLSAAASDALVRIGGNAARAALAEAASRADTVHQTLALETALLHFELPPDVLADLAVNGASGAVRSGAFAALATISHERCLAILRDTGGVIRLDFLRALAGNPAAAPLVLDHFSDLSAVEQQVVLAAASQAEIRAAEAHAIEVLKQSDDEALRTAALFALIRIGGEAAWPVLLSQYEESSGVTRTLYDRALGSLEAPRLDQQLFEQARTGSPADRVSAIELITLRNPEGSTTLLKQIIAEESDPQVVGAGLQASETLGDYETLDLLISRVLRESDPQILRKAQISAKRVTAGTDAFQRAWYEIYAPPLNDPELPTAVKERLAVILDAVPTEQTLAYMEKTVTSGPPELRTAVIRNYIRWTDIRAIDGIASLLVDAELDPRERQILWVAAMRILTNENVANNAGWGDMVERGVALFQLADEQRQREILEFMSSKAEYHTRRARNAFLEIDGLTESQKALIKEILET